MSYLNYRTVGLTAIILTYFSNSVMAASSLNPTLNDDLTLRLGGVFLDGDTTVSSTIKDSEIPIDTEIDLGDLGLDGNTTSLWLGGHWRFSDRWRLDYEYYGSRQDGSGSTDVDINFGDIVIEAGIEAKAEFNTDIYALGVGWSFLRDEKSELGVGLGLHVVDLKTSIEGMGYIKDIEDAETAFVKETATATAPLPNARLYGGYAFSPTLALEGSIGWFSLTYDNFDGDLTTATAVLEWRPWDNFGVGIGYTFFDVDLTVDDDLTRDLFKFSLNGPILFLSTGF